MEPEKAHGGHALLHLASSLVIEVRQEDQNSGFGDFKINSVFDVRWTKNILLSDFHYIHCMIFL